MWRYADDDPMNVADPVTALWRMENESRDRTRKRRQLNETERRE